MMAACAPPPLTSVQVKYFDSLQESEARKYKYVANLLKTDKADKFTGGLAGKMDR